MRINLHVQFEDNTSKDITCNAADLVAFENEFNVAVSQLGAQSKLGHLLYLAWHSEKRTKSTELSYDDWLGTVASIGDSEADPKSKG